MSLGAAAGALDRVNLTAALHLLVIGFFAAMTLGMVSRVTLGHSGRPLVADGVTWSCYLGVLAAGLLRVLAELPLAPSARSYLLVATGLVWLAAFGVWAWRYVPMYLSPRVDARR